MQGKDVNGHSAAQRARAALSSMTQITACRAQIVRTSDTMLMTERQNVRMPDKMSETVVSTVFPIRVMALKEHRDQTCSGLA
jgi:hypothetical protein